MFKIYDKENRKLSKTLLVSIGINYMYSQSLTFISLRLTGGTLLGWYRDCGIIPFSQDADMSMMSDEFDKKLQNEFMGSKTTNKAVKIWLTLGIPVNSFEMRMSGCDFTYDLMLTYKRTQTKQCISYHAKYVHS